MADNIEIFLLMMDLRLVDDHGHAHLTVLLLSAVDPDWRCVVHSDFKDGWALSLGRVKAGEDAPVWLDRNTRGLEGGLDDRVILGEVVEVYFVPRVGSHNVWCKGEAILTDIDINGLC